MNRSRTYPQDALSIGQASKRTGLSARSIRYYESLGIIGRASRAASGYRRFSDKDIRTLQMIRNARILTFDLKEIGRMVECWRDRGCRDAEISDLLSRRVARLQREETRLRASRTLLEEIQRISTRRPRPDCSILRLLMGERGPLASQNWPQS